MSNLLNVTEVAEILGQSEITVRRYARENLLTPISEKGSKDVKFDEEEVKRYLSFSKKSLH